MGHRLPPVPSGLSRAPEAFWSSDAPDSGHVEGMKCSGANAISGLNISFKGLAQGCIPKSTTELEAAIPRICI